MTVYRITHKKYADTLLASGMENRWNLQGQYVIYTSSTKALACLENLVHTSGLTLGSKLYVCLEIFIPETTTLKKISAKEMANKDNAGEIEIFTRETGSRWYTDNRELLLQVPSAVIPSEHNYIIHTLHNDFKKVRILSAESFIFDPRLK